MNAHEHADSAPLWKLALAWAGTVWGSITMQDVVLTLTAIYTAAQLYVLWRDKIRGPKK